MEAYFFLWVLRTAVPEGGASNISEFSPEINMKYLLPYFFLTFLTYSWLQHLL